MSNGVPQTSIPLRCGICPKRPNFSDLSHLLTHVASKGHLAQQFKATVRASTDEVARGALQSYNDWYQKYGIEQLCANRLKTNEAKKAKARNGRDTAPRAHVSSSSTPSQPETVNDHDFGTINHSSTRHDLEDDSLLASSVDVSAIQAAQHRAHVPRMHLWSTETHTPKLEQHHRPYEAWLYTNHYDPPGHPLEPVSYVQASRLGYPMDSATLDHSPIPAQADDSELVSEVVVPQGHEAQLKGVYWPGMDLFDSAPPELRRKRNQKKDGSVLAQMELNSTLVEPTELIFWADGDFKKERRIYSPTELSPSELDMAPPKRRRSSRASKPVLTESSVNVPRPVKRPRGGKAMGRPDLPRTYSTPVIPEQRPGPTQRRGSAIAHSGAVAYSVHNHPVMSVREPTISDKVLEDPERRKRSFSIFKDDDDTGFEQRTQSPFSPSHGGHDFGGSRGFPASMSNLLNTSTTAINDGEGTPSQQHLTSFYKSVMSGPSGKENDHLGTGARACSEERTEAYPSDGEDYPPRFFEPIPMVDFGSFRPAPTFGYPTNPLSMGPQPVHGHGYELPQSCRTRLTDASQHASGLGGGMRSVPLGLSLKPEVGEEFENEMLFHGLRG
ncbi:MAG: hypothetical protein M1816_001962 [Peltula sp. TS41687]|nr:MAG: hypothetical protein M1816_001962 [Peltula sp. TS41687]